MKYFILFSLVFITAQQASATTCLNYLKNCQGRSAEKKYIGDRAICKMEATCDSYCGQMNLGRGPNTLYCGMLSKDSCQAADDCAADNSITRADISRVTSRPTSDSPNAPNIPAPCDNGRAQ